MGVKSGAYVKLVLAGLVFQRFTEPAVIVAEPNPAVLSKQLYPLRFNDLKGY